MSVPEAPESTYHEGLWARGQVVAGGYQPGQNHRVDVARELLGRGQHLLDVGCGPGTLGVALEGRFELRSGVDIAGSAVAAARARGIDARIVNLNLEPLPYADRSFDAVAALAALNYLYAPSTALEECRRVLRPAGRLVIALPNLRTYWRILRLIGGRFPSTSTHRDGRDGGALHYYCFRDMVALLDGAGFRAVRSVGIHCVPSWLGRLPDRGLPGWIKREFLAAEIVIAAEPT